MGFSPCRVSVIGVSGAGKTTFARELARRLAIPHVEMDAYHHGRNWALPPLEEFRARTEQETSGDGWVIDGNYTKAQDIVWSRADTVVWLDYPFAVIFSRLWWRTMRRLITREKLWANENQETWRDQFFSHHSIFLWVIKTYPRYRREYPTLFARPDYAHLRVVRLRSPHAAQAWLDQFPARQ
jgi:adenylate kinase family enzyme